MTWVALAAATAVVYALHGAWSKRVSEGAGPVVAAWGLVTFAFPLLAAYQLLHGVPELGPRFWPVVAVNYGLHLGAAYLFFSALRAGDLSITYPLLALTPLLVIPVEFVLLRELPAPAGVAGVGMVAAGIYLLNFSERRAGFLAPFLALTRSPGARRSLAVATVWSLTGTLDRVAVLESSPSFYGVVLTGGLSLLFLPILVMAGRLRTRPPVAAAAAPDHGFVGVTPPPERAQGLLRGASLGLLAVHGSLFALMFILQMEALQLALASYVLSIKRTGAILAVVLGWLAFREAAFGHRLAGTAVTVAGVAIVVIWG